MKIRKARQILKSFADDTRLRIINLLKTKKEISVALDLRSPWYQPAKHIKTSYQASLNRCCWGYKEKEIMFI